MNKLLCVAIMVAMLGVVTLADPSPPVWSSSFHVAFD